MHPLWRLLTTNPTPARANPTAQNTFLHLARKRNARQVCLSAGFGEGPKCGKLPHIHVALNVGNGRNARRMVGTVAGVSRARCMTQISDSDGARYLATKVVIDDGPTSSTGFGAVSACRAANPKTSLTMSRMCAAVAGAP